MIHWGPQFSLDYGCTEANWLLVPSYNPRYTPYYDGRVRLQTVRLMDASLNKMTRLTERYSLQLRLECFNVMNSFLINTLQFNNNATDANFGSIIKATVKDDVKTAVEVIVQNENEGDDDKGDDKGDDKDDKDE